MNLILPICVPVGDGCLFSLPDSVTFTRSSTFAIGAIHRRMQEGERP